jgi:hypothetical protein
MPRIVLESPIPDAWKHDPAVAARTGGAVKFPGGKVIGIVDNGKLKKFGDVLEWHLRARGASDVVRWGKNYAEGEPSDALIAEVCSQVDATVVGLGN